MKIDRNLVEPNESYIKDTVLRAQPTPRVSVEKFINGLGTTYSARDVHKAFEIMEKEEPDRAARVIKKMEIQAKKGTGFLNGDDQRYLAHLVENTSLGVPRYKI